MFFTKFRANWSRERLELEPIKTFVSWSKCKFESQSHLANPVQLELSTTVIWSVLESDSSNFDLCPTILFGSVLANGILSMSSSNQFYPTRLNIPCSIRTQNPVSTAILKYYDSPSPTKNPKPIKCLRETFVSKRVHEKISKRNLQCVVLK